MVSDALASELMALLEGLLLSQKESIGNIIIEGDSLIIIKVLENTQNLSWKLLMLWKNITNIFNSNLYWQVSYSRRECNKIAEQLSKLKPPYDI